MHPNVCGADQRLEQAKVHGIGLIGLAPYYVTFNIETKS